MNSLRAAVEHQRAQNGDSGSPFYAINDDVTTLRVETSGGEVWMLPWHHFIFGRHVFGDYERLILTFVAHEVALRGVNLVALIPEVANQRIAWLRAAPRKYLRGAKTEPAIDDIQVRSLAEPIVSE